MMAHLDFSTIGDLPGSPAFCLAELRSWRRNDPSAPFADFLSTRAPIENDLLIELATTDLINQINNGILVNAEDYYDPAVPIENQKEFVLDLVDAELCVRSDRGETIEHRELADRFPLLENEMDRLLQVHQLDVETRSDDSNWNTFYDDDKSNESAHEKPVGKLQNPRLLGQYQLGRPLANNGQCKYWTARHQETNRPVLVFWYALSAIACDSFDLNRLDRIRDCHHPALTPIIDCGVDDGQVFVVFENESATLLTDHWLNLTDHQIVETLLPIVEAIDFASGCNVTISGFSAADISLANSTATKDAAGKLARPRLLDFGLQTFANAIEKPFTRTPKTSPTPRNPVTDPQKNSLIEIGVLLFSIALTEIDIEEIQTHLCDGFDPISLRKIDGTVSNKLDAIYLACVNSDPKQSYTSRQELISDLRRFLAGKNLAVTKKQRRGMFGW